MTVVDASIFTAGRRRCASPFATTPMPMNPVSDEPIESVIIPFGSSSRYCSLTLGENSAALLEITNSDDTS